jgi:hypothetical protein
MADAGGCYPFAHGLFIALMESVSTSETSVIFNVTTRRYKQDASKLYRYSFFLAAKSSVVLYNVCCAGILKTMTTKH